MPRRNRVDPWATCTPSLRVGYSSAIGAASSTITSGSYAIAAARYGSSAGCAVHLVLTGVTAVPPAGLAWSADLTGVLA
jgi:hypothetical protein